MIIENKQFFVKVKKLVSIISIFFSFFLVSPVLANYYGLEKTAGSAGVTQNIIGNGDVQSFVGSVVGIVLSLISIIFFLFMLYGGFMWMTARGSAEQIKKAQETIIAAVIGIVVVLGAYALTTFIFNSLSGTTSSLGIEEQQNVLNQENTECIQNEDCLGDMICINGICKIDPSLGTLRLAQENTCPKFDQMSACVIRVGENNNAVDLNNILNQIDSLLRDCNSVDSVEGLDVVYSRVKDLLTQNELAECIQ